MLKKFSKSFFYEDFKVYQNIHVLIYFVTLIMIQFIGFEQVDFRTQLQTGSFNIITGEEPYVPDNRIFICM